MSDIVTLVGGQPVTTSLVIADGVQHEHRAVLKLLRDYLPDFEDFGRVAFEVQPFETAGGTQQREVAILNEHHATLLITFMRNIGPVKDFKKRLVKAFWDMARQLTQPAVPQSLPEALRLAADLADQKAKAQAALAIAAPKAAALDRIALETEGAVCLRVAAKLVQVPEKQFTSFLSQQGWIFRHHHSNTWQGYSDKEKAGDPRVYLHRPMQFGDQVLASDSRILVCIPGHCGHEEAPSSVRNLTRRIEQIIEEAPLTWTPAAAIDLPPPEPCTRRDGSGVMYRVDCPECGGAGEFERGAHTYCCNECDGEGSITNKHPTHGARSEACDICEGSGASLQPVTVGEMRVQRRYLASIAELPNAQVAPTHEEQALVFIFDGGWGALAPLR